MLSPLVRIVEQGFLGANHFLLPDGRVKPVSRKRVGIAGMKAPARGDTEVYSAGEGARRIGRISSGGFSPSAQKPIAMGCVLLTCCSASTLPSSLSMDVR